MIDKNCFQGIYEPLLTKFVKNYNVVTPYALAVECLISKSRTSSKHTKDSMVLLERFDRLIKAGAKFGYLSYKLFKAEKMNLCPVRSVIDEISTKRFRDTTPKTSIDFVKHEAEYCREAFEPRINLLLDLAKKFYGNLRNNRSLSKQFRQEANIDRVERLKQWIQAVDEQKDSILRKCFSKEISSHADNIWFTWQMTRLQFAWGIEWACQRNSSGPSFENTDISNDLYDIEYVAYLSRTDGLLTRDEKLVKPLAKAAFPEKDVFSSLDEVSDEYICHWSKY